MRPKVKICGEVFDVDTVEGGKLRASSASLPGFELIAPNHNMLRERMQKALAAYDAEQLTKPQEDAQQAQAPAYMYTGVPPSYVVVNDRISGCNHTIPCHLRQIKGDLMAISQFGIEYKAQRFLSNSPQNLVDQLRQILQAAEAIGATDVVWRFEPEVRGCTIDPANPYDLYARFHFQPQFVNTQITWHQNGMPIQIV